MATGAAHWRATVVQARSAARARFARGTGLVVARACASTRAAGGAVGQRPHWDWRAEARAIAASPGAGAAGDEGWAFEERDTRPEERPPMAEVLAAHAASG